MAVETMHQPRAHKVCDTHLPSPSNSSPESNTQHEKPSRVTTSRLQDPALSSNPSASTIVQMSSDTDQQSSSPDPLICPSRVDSGFDPGSSASPSSSSDDMTIYRFRGVGGIRKFWEICCGDGNRLSDGRLDHSEAKRHIEQMQILHLHLNEEMHDDFIDDLLADAFTSFDIHSDHGSTLRKLFIHVQGNFLFTKNTHMLPQPATAMNYSAAQDWFNDPVDRILYRLAFGRHQLAISEKEDLIDSRKLKPIVSAKAFIEPLLRLRNIPSIEITGPMEAELQREILSTISISLEPDSPLEFDSDEEENLTPGELWDMARMPRNGRAVQRERRMTFSGHDRGIWVFPTEETHRIVLGWPLEDVRVSKKFTQMP